MEKFLLLSTAAACVFALVRIIVIAIRIRIREKDIIAAEKEDRTIFYSEIDDVSVMGEIVKSIATILALWVCPLSIFNLWYCSYAGIFSKIISLIAICYGYILALKKINSQLF